MARIAGGEIVSGRLGGRVYRNVGGEGFVSAAPAVVNPRGRGEGKREGIRRWRQPGGHEPLGVLGYGMENDRPRFVIEGSGDVGDVGRAGSATLDAETNRFTLTGSGANMWFGEDAFQFAWMRVEGDASLRADLEFVGEGLNPHRKACLMVRASLDPDSACAYIAVHGDGLTSLQFRRAKGATTREVQSFRSFPRSVEIACCDGVVSAKAEGEPTGGSVRLALAGPYHIGLGVCSHERDVLETARFSNVVFDDDGRSADFRFCTLETVEIASTDRRAVLVRKEPHNLGAPNWTTDGRLVFNDGGRLFSLPWTGGPVTPIDTGFAVRCNNDHGLSPDGTRIVVSDGSQGDGQSRIYTLPVGGGSPERITEEAPSYWHGWSPDGRTLAFCGRREGKFGIFTVPAEGGEERRLTTADGLDDGPDYTPDGRYIVFNSDRSGTMQLYRMRTDGSEVERLTDDGHNDWFPHPSPDGRWIAFLSYGADVAGHPPDKEVQIRLMDLRDGTISVLAELFGGQGTINVPSWSPDSKRLAFVSYHFAQ